MKNISLFNFSHNVWPFGLALSGVKNSMNDMEMTVMEPTERNDSDGTHRAVLITKLDYETKIQTVAIL